MLDTIFNSRAMRVLTQTRSLIALFGLAVLLIIGFIFLQQRLGTEILDALPRYDVGEFIEHMVVYEDNQAIGMYQRSIFTLDLAFPIVYTLLYIGLITRLAGGGWLRVLAVLPLVTFWFDIWEGIRIYALLNAWPSIVPDMVEQASWTTQAKWMLSRIVLGTIVVLALWRGVPRLVARLSR